MIDRSKTSQALAKAITYKQCGKDAEAAQWARQLVELLECAEILRYHSPAFNGAKTMETIERLKELQRRAEMLASDLRGIKAKLIDDADEAAYVALEATYVALEAETKRTKLAR